MDLLYVLRYRYMDIATQQDSKKISEAKVDELSTKADNEFFSDLRRRDAVRQRNFTNGMLAISDGLNQAPRYTPTPMPSYAPVSQPSMPSMPPQMPVNNTLMNSYNQPPPAPLGIGQGARGYDGATGQADKIYIPAGPDPNPPLNVMGQ